MAQSKIVVAFEENESVRQAHAAEWGQRVLLYQARTPEEALGKVYKYRDELGLLIVHAYWDYHCESLPELIRQARRWFKGPILGISRDPSLLQMLTKAGCTRTCEVAGMSSMESLKREIFAILGIE